MSNNLIEHTTKLFQINTIKCLYLPLKISLSHSFISVVKCPPAETNLLELRCPISISTVSVGDLTNSKVADL